MTSVGLSLRAAGRRRLPTARADGAGATVTVAAAAVLTAMSAGTLAVAFADRFAREGAAGAEALFWLGLVAIVAPAAARVASGSVRRPERLLVLAWMGLALYLVKVLHSPIEFTFHDEFSSLRATDDLIDGGELFRPDPLIEVHPFYPVLQVVTASVASVTGLSIFTSGLVVLGVARLVLVLALFLLFEKALGSSRAAGLATVVYAANPNFLFFDAQFAYESIALPLAAVAVWMVARRASVERGRRAFTALTVLVIGSVCVAHPMTSYALAGFLVLWGLLHLHAVRRARRPGGPSPELFPLIAVLLAVAWALAAGTGVGGYLWPVLRDAGQGALDILAGDSPHKRVFRESSGDARPAAEQIVGYAAALLLSAGVVYGLARVWRHRAGLPSLPVALAIVALAYPASLLARFGQSTTEIANRSSEFVYIGVAFVVAFGLERLLRHGGRRRAIATGAALLAVGGAIVGWAPYARLPGSYLVGADPRSVTAESVAAATWARTELPPDSRLLTDRSNGLLMGSYGHHDPVVGSVEGERVLTVVTASVFGETERRIIRNDHLAFIVVDRRLSTDLPAVGVYFERDEPGAYQHRVPISAAALAKFDGAPGVSRIYDSGNLVVYDVRAISQAGAGGR